MSDREQAGPGSSSYGHQFQNNEISGHAQVQFGNVYGSQENSIGLLPVASNAPFDSIDKQYDPPCLPGTRVDVLKEIKAWAEDTRDGRCVLWLNGMAGTGKSTIARTAARQHREQNHLGASFFFARGGGDAGNAAKFFTSIAVQLTQKSPALKRSISKAVDENRDIFTRALREQWELLIFGPLAITQPEVSQLPLLLVIDALDECDDDRDIRLILDLLAPVSKHQLIAQLRILVTSRPETPIRLGFQENPGIWHRDLGLGDICRDIIDDDLTLYFRTELKGIQPDANVISCLIEKACGLFIWAATACRFIKTGKRWLDFASRRLTILLEGESLNRNPEKELDIIYAKVLSDSMSGDYEEEEKEELYERFRRIVGAIVILFSPISTNAIALLLKRPNQEAFPAREEVKNALADLHSVLAIPKSSKNPIRLLHPSFRDFLLAKERCPNPHLRINPKQAHRNLLDGCIQLMSSSLKKDICGLHDPGTFVTDVTRNQVDKLLHPELQYACLYWVQHLLKSGAELHDNDQVHQFLQVHLLHWLESLAWLGSSSAGILAILSLEDHTKAEESPGLHAFVHDARRFATYNRTVLCWKYTDRQCDKDAMK